MMDNLTDIQKKYIFFFCIGIFTFYLSGYVLRGFHPPQNIYLMLLIYGILFGIGILFSKERSSVFVVNAFVISFVALLLISAGFFAWSAYGHMNSKSISADLLDYTPEDFVVVTEEELNDYPALKETIETQRYVKASPGEWRRTIEFLEEKGSYVIKVGDEYYGISFSTA
ncbi:hypothetical protein [Methanococcoides methylutens]|uniref:Uncharacterized protein n=1 Tax=Methanococcoides methylutens MM1 TaxID=1434104 RepID=A0A0E3SRP9_METMT|nr:hypothetical protein [Methanococcoides methylutens]AKB84912.1 hypothetical protein MCMEM_0859 [Methanococcoides methylutens MM1]